MFSATQGGVLSTIERDFRSHFCAVGAGIPHSIPHCREPNPTGHQC